MKLDFTNLKKEVTSHWERLGIRYWIYDNNCFNEPDPTNYGTRLLPRYREVLGDPHRCIHELGFSSISSYIESKKRQKRKKLTDKEQPMTEKDK